MNKIRVDNLDSLIKKVSFNLDSLNSNLNSLQRTIGDLDNCYSGKDLTFAFSELQRQDGNLVKIPETVQSYSDVLASVKTAYQSQDESIQSLFNRANAE